MDRQRAHRLCAESVYRFFVVVIFACVNIADWIKCVIGFVLVKKGVWLQNIVSRKE